MAYPYLDVDGFKTRSSMPNSSVEELEAQKPGYLAARAVMRSAQLNSRLAKRYVTPFGVAPVSPSTAATLVPDAVIRWMVAWLTLDAYKALGFDPSSEQDKTILDDAKQADDEVREAADSESGLFELPLRTTDPKTGITQGGPYFYSEPDPYSWTDIQHEEARRYGR